MAEIIFILVTVYTVYVVHSAFSKNQEKNGSASLKPDKSKVENPAVKEEKIKPVAKPKAEPKKQKSAPKKATTPAKKESIVPEGSLRNPETGEIDKIANSYRMLKRWMKEALVEEKLLDKIYKTNQLDDASKKKIEKSLAKMKKMDKYQ